MYKKSVKLLAVIMAVLMVSVYVPLTDLNGAFSIEASAASYDGGLGGNVKWKYDSGSKTLTVSGSGNMNNYSGVNSEWTKYRALLVGSIADKATKIVINSGVTNIGNNAFRGLKNVTSVSIPASVTSIGQSAFENCNALSSVNLTGSLKSIGAYAFKNTKFANVTMPYSVTSVGDYAFANVSGLKVKCNYGDAAYNSTVKYASSSVDLRKPAIAVEGSLDAAKKQLNVTVKINDAAGTGAANFTIVYNSDSVKPASTETIFETKNDISKTVVFNQPGKISAALMSTQYIKMSDCTGNCEYTLCTLTFDIIGHGDTANISVTPTVILFADGRYNAQPANSDISLHNYSGDVVKEATCCEEGIRNVTCSICGKNTQEAVAKNPDNHAGGTSIANAKEATCQTAGYTGDTVCAGCGAVLSKGQEIPAAGNHTFGEWTAVKAATCQEGGTEERVCSGCGEKETREIPKTEHDYTAEVKAPTCTDAGYTVYICSVCGDTYTGDRTSALGHSYDANGVCIRCGYVKVSSIEFTSSSKLTADSTKKTVTSKNLLTVKELTAQIKTTGWTVTTADGKAVSESSAVGTGYILKNTSGNLAYTMVIIGDVNCDGKVNASDARFALRVSAKLEKTDDYTGAAADVDGNSKVTAADARTILRVAAKLDTF